MAKMRNPISLPAGGASQANVDKSLSQATDEIKEVVYKSVAGLEVELNKTASATANGTLVVEPSNGKDVMEKATVTVAIPLEDNKAATIDVSQYASAVEVTPTDGKTAMKKATVTLSNIPVLESNKAATIDVSQYSEAVEVTPSSNKDAMEKATVTLTNIPDIEANKEASITQNGTVEITPSSGKDAMAKTTVTVNVSGGADLEDNKTATIDVSTYTQPVEITPSEGKDGMKKATVTLSNIPSGGVSKLYYINDLNSDDNGYYISKDPSTLQVGDTVFIINSAYHSEEYGNGYGNVTITSVDTSGNMIIFETNPSANGRNTFERTESYYSQYDVIPAGGTPKTATVYEWDTQVPGETDSLCLGTFTETPTTSDLALVVGEDSDFNYYFVSSQITQVGTEEKTWYEGGEEVTRTVPYIVCRSQGTDYKAYYFGKNIQF